MKLDSRMLEELESVKVWANQIKLKSSSRQKMRSINRCLVWSHIYKKINLMLRIRCKTRANNNFYFCVEGERERIYKLSRTLFFRDDFKRFEKVDWRVTATLLRGIQLNRATMYALLVFPRLFSRTETFNLYQVLLFLLKLPHFPITSRNREVHWITFGTLLFN